MQTFKRGQVCQETGMVFWSKNRYGPYFITVDKYREYMDYHRKYTKEWKAQRMKDEVFRQKRNAQSMKSYRARRNSDKYREYTKRYQAERKQKDPAFALSCLMRGRITALFRRAKMKKSGKAERMLGCTWEQLVAHMESKFQPGMSWANRGRNGWHIDHIIPVSSATTAEEMAKLNHYTNLQPLWEADNIRKGNKKPPSLIEGGL